MLKYCPNCGKKVEDYNAQHCVACGTFLGEEELSKEEYSFDDCVECLKYLESGKVFRNAMIHKWTVLIICGLVNYFFVRQDDESSFEALILFGLIDLIVCKVLHYRTLSKMEKERRKYFEIHYCQPTNRVDLLRACNYVRDYLESKHLSRTQKGKATQEVWVSILSRMMDRNLLSSEECRTIESLTHRFVIHRSKDEDRTGFQLMWFMLILISMVLPLFLSSKLDIFNLL